jgi:integrase
MAFYAGVRLGELRAMRWEQVRLSESVVRIDRSLDATGQVIEPKSRAGNRTVPIVNRLAELLSEHRLSGSGGGFVFGRSPDQPFAPNVVLRRAYTAWRRAGLEPIGLHDARHTYASLLIAAGVNAKAVSAYMGHGSIQVTFDRYGHLMPGSEVEAATMLEAYLDRADTAARLAQIDP